MTISYAATTRKLANAYAELTPELQKAARFMLENPEEIGLNSMRTVARKAGVKPATVSRLSKALGFMRYENLREPFRERLRRPGPSYANGVEDLQQRAADSRNLFDELRDQEVRNIEQTLSEENFAALDNGAEMLHNSRRIYVLGLRGAHAPAFIFHYAYQLFQDNSILVDTHAGIFADQLRGIGSGDSLLVVSFPPYTQLTIDAVHYAAEAGARIIAITDSMVSPAASEAGHTIVARNRSASFYHSFTGALTVVQALIMLLVGKKGGDAVDIARQAEQQLSRVSAYW